MDRKENSRYLCTSGGHEMTQIGLFMSRVRHKEKVVLPLSECVVLAANKVVCVHARTHTKWCVCVCV